MSSSTSFSGSGEVACFREGLVGGSGGEEEIKVGIHIADGDVMFCLSLLLMFLVTVGPAGVDGEEAANVQGFMTQFGLSRYFTLDFIFGIILFVGTFAEVCVGNDTLTFAELGSLLEDE